MGLEVAKTDPLITHYRDPSPYHPQAEMNYLAPL